MSKALIYKLFFIVILLLAFFLRIYGINWDNGFHFHPDERMLIMVADRVHLFDQLNPDFFNYGTLPIYILKGVSQIVDLFTVQPIANYDGMLYVGRALSVFNDLIVIVLIYLLAKELFKKRSIAIWSTLLYSLSFFPIQNSHFFISDTFLNLFGTLLIYLLLHYIKSPRFYYAIAIGIVFAAAITSKVTALVFLPVIGLALLYPVIQHRTFHSLKKPLVHGLILIGTIIPFSFMFMPYAYLSWERFFRDITLQLQMNSDPYIFPYTLQYVGTLPYLYYIKNIAVWGVGPFIFGLFIVGIFESITQIKWKELKTHLFNPDKHSFYFIIFFLFYITYFTVAGRTAVKFMRYMLIMYPFIAILAGYGVYTAMESLEGISRKIGIAFITVGIFIWTLAFVNIYSQENTRIRASRWIVDNIPAGSVLAVEHWDDRVPIFDPGLYQYTEMTLYERPDDEAKWSLLKQKLESTDYVVIASNRLYIPLQKLKDCSKYKYCYPKTAEYYQRLFTDTDEFIKVAEFTSYPSLKIGPWSVEIVDDLADESFTVYDHPKIMIFRKI